MNEFTNDFNELNAPSINENELYLVQVISMIDIIDVNVWIIMD